MLQACEGEFNKCEEQCISNRETFEWLQFIYTANTCGGSEFDCSDNSANPSGQAWIKAYYFPTDAVEGAEDPITMYNGWANTTEIINFSPGPRAPTFTVEVSASEGGAITQTFEMGGQCLEESQIILGANYGALELTGWDSIGTGRCFAKIQYDINNIIYNNDKTKPIRATVTSAVSNSNLFGETTWAPPDLEMEFPDEFIGTETGIVTIADLTPGETQTFRFAVEGQGSMSGLTCASSSEYTFTFDYFEEPVNPIEPPETTD